MAKLRVTGKRFSLNGMLGITMIAVFVVAVAAIVVAGVVLPNYADVEDYKTPDVVAIVTPDNGLISVGADPSKVFVTVKYSDGSSQQVALSELVVTGLDTTTEGTLDGVVLDYGGFKQTVSFNVVPTELQIEYIAGTGGRIEGEAIQNVTAGANATRVEAIPEDGYRFSGWSDGDRNASRLDKQVSKSMRLIATFEKLRYTVIFYYPDGTTAREQIVAYNDAPMYVPRADEQEMQLYGYTFVGWDTDFTHITKDTNIYPVYKKHATDFHIEYTTDKDGYPLGFSNALEYYENDETASVRIEANSNNYEFVGWSIYDVDLQSWIDLDPDMENGKLIRVGANYAIEFRSSRVGDSKQYDLVFVPTEYVEEILVKAHFVFKESTITFSSMNSVVHPPITLKYQEPIGNKFDVENLNDQTMLGYAFKGWYASGGEVNPDGTPIIVNNQTTFTQPTELIAYWEKEVFTALFLRGDNESTAFTDASQGYVENFMDQAGVNGRIVKAYYQDNLASAIEGAFPVEIPVKTNYTFKGWYLADADRQPTSKVVDKSFKLESPITYVYPVFEENTKTLTVSIVGSGTVVSRVETEDGDIKDVGITSRIEMPVTKDYTIRITPSEGYALTSVFVNGLEYSSANLAEENGYYDVTIDAIIQEDYQVKAVFTLNAFNLNITNGANANNHGTITYSVLGTEESYTSTDAIIDNIKVNYGGSISIEISALNDNYANSKEYYIDSVYYNGENVVIPNEAVYYNLIIENVSSNQNVVISYRQFRYRVTVPAESDKGIMSGALTEFNRGSDGLFDIQARDGYYIRKVTANGTLIDPYLVPNGYVVTLDEGQKENDYRITHMQLKLLDIQSDVIFEVEYANLYYNVTTSYEGIGIVSTPFTVNYGQSFTVKASTSSGYYVAAYVIDGGEPQYYDDVQLAREFEVGKALKDYDVKFIFSKTTYYARFVDESGYSTVTFDGNKINLDPAQGGHTFSDVEHGQTVDFLVEAKEGYYINSIQVESKKGGTIRNEDINLAGADFIVKSHVVTLVNVNGSYEVTIECLPITLNYDVYMLNKAGNEVQINGYTLGADVNTFSSSITYGSALTINIIPQDGYSLELENVIIRNKDPREEYPYEALEGEYVATPGKGFYSILTSETYGYQELTLFVYDVHSEIDVFVYMEEEDSDASVNVINYVSEGNGTIKVESQSVEIASGSAVATDAEVKFTLTPGANSQVKVLLINGNVVPVVDGVYTMTIKEDLEVMAVFGGIYYTVETREVENGTISANKSLILAGSEDLIIKLSPVEGYYIDENDFVITIYNSDGTSIIKRPLTEANYDPAKGYTLKKDEITGNVTLSAEFLPITYSLTYSSSENGVLDGVGQTGEDLVSFGTTKMIDLIADAGYFISSILVNGESISPKTLVNQTINNGECIIGTLQLYVSGDLDLVVEFAPMVYTIVVNDSLGGTTTVKKDNSAYEDASNIKLGAGDKVSLKLQAEEGYHISYLEINGRVIEDWNKSDSVSNDINQVFYTIEGVVNGNIMVVVRYTINEYTINVNAVNKSLNFASVDVDASTYGVVTVNGSTPNLSTKYTHGSNVKFLITPRTARGYYVAKLEFVYIGDDGEEESTVINNFNTTGGAYILRGISRDIIAVNVEFTRTTFSYEQWLTLENSGSSYEFTGSLEATFTNPYNNNPVEAPNGQYEYGLNYSIKANPGEGYKHKVFELNGEDRMEYLTNRNNVYAGTITSDLEFRVTYEIQTIYVKAIGSGYGEYSIHDVDNTLIWEPGIEIPEEEQRLATGTAWIKEDGVIVTYGTELIFSALPDASNGYRIAEFLIGTDTATITNEDGLMRVSKVIKESSSVNGAIPVINYSVKFTIHVYTIQVNSFVGGVAQISSSRVTWNQSASIRLVIERGYVLVVNDTIVGKVLVNGDEKPDVAAILGKDGVYTIDHVTSNWNIEITLANKEYDVTLAGDYDKEYQITQKNGNVKTINAVSGIIVNENVIGKNARAYYTNVAGGFQAGEGNTAQLIEKAVFNDKLTIVLQVPNGYRIDNVFITMDNDGGLVSNLVLGESDLDIDDGSGVRTYTISSMKGNVVVNVTYAIKVYEVEYKMASGGNFESTGITLVSHHELFEIRMVSDEGFYLSRLEVNGRVIPTVYTKNSMRYNYTTTTSIKGSDGSMVEKLLEIDDTFVNGQDKIVITTIYEKQRFTAQFYVNNVHVTSASQTDSLGIELKGNEFVYDPVVSSTILHTLKEGYSITSLALYSQRKGSSPVIYNFGLEGSSDRNYNTYTPKGASVSVRLDESIISMMDYHSTSNNTIYVYYEVEKDVHESLTSMYLVSAEQVGSDVVNKGRKVEANEVPTILENGRRVPVFTLTTSYSDRIATTTHDYGTEATITISIAVGSINTYSFQGFQEYVNGVWTYVTHDPNGSGISLESNGQRLSYTMTQDREFRAVFFRVYEITVQIHPEYKYIEGSFASNDPSRMRYRQYASLTAVASYSTNNANGVILPNVVGTQENLTDVDGTNDASYTYRVLSGAKLILRGNDSISINPTPQNGYAYSVVSYEGGRQIQRDDTYVTGVETLEDRLVYAYFKNVMYASFAMETVGAKTSSEGGTVTYARDGEVVGSLTNNSLDMRPGQTLTITIIPKANYRFDGIMELLPLSTPDSQGYKQFSSNYSPLTEKADGSVTINKQVDSNGRVTRVVVTLNKWAENSIFKIRFWKQINVTSKVSLITDEGRNPGYTIGFTNNSTADGLYDYNTELFYDIKFGLMEQNTVGFKKYYQFVGYFINGVNAYTQLLQNYPSTYEGAFILNNLDGLVNGVTIVDQTTVVDNVPYTSYHVEIVAKFVPVYNIVIENEYLYNGNYLDPGQITASAIMYDETLTQYFTSSVNVDPKLGDNNSDKTDATFQMLGKMNTVDSTNKNTADSTYNTWNDNKITLNWVGGSSSSDTFALIAWQYYARVSETKFEWRNIPYVDPNSQTNMVNKPTFTFPVSCLYDTTYPAYVDSNGNAPAGSMFDASKYDYNGNYESSQSIAAIRIRPLFQKVERMTLIKSTALYDETIFIDGQGDSDPKIGSTQRSAGYFNYYSVQTLFPSAIQGYEFAGWYVTENGNGGAYPLSLTGTASTPGVIEVVEENYTYYLMKEEIRDINGVGTGKYITYSFNPVNNQMNVLMDASFEIYARYIRTYNISIMVTNLSGYSQVLTDSMPTLNCYKWEKVGEDYEWVLQSEISGNRMITIESARVGAKYKFTLSTNYSRDLNDTVRFNPLFDRFVNITAVNDDNRNVWDGGASPDLNNSKIPTISALNEYLLNGSSSAISGYNNAIKGMEIVITANDQKTVNVNFESYGTLVLHNVYVGSAIKLPNELGGILYDADPNSVELGTDVYGDEAYFVKDGGIGDTFNGGIVDGIIAIRNIPILVGRTFDGEVKGDYANRLIDNFNVLDSDNISIGVNFDGSSIRKKIQHIVYYGSASWVEYEYGYDGKYDPAESYEDLNGNGQYDEGEPFTDGNGIWDDAESFIDEGNGKWDDAEAYTDTNSNGQYDAGEPFVDANRNGKWDDAEAFTDGNGVWDDKEDFIDLPNGSYDVGEDYNDLPDGKYTYGESFVDANGNGKWDGAETYTDLNGNGKWDESEPFVEIYENGKWDASEPFEDTVNVNGVWDDAEEYTDTNGNGMWDAAEKLTDIDGDGKWDPAEPYVDVNSNGKYDPAEKYIDRNGNGKWDTAEEYTDANGNGKYDAAESFNDANANGVWDGAESYVDANSNGAYDEGEEFDDANANGIWDDAETLVDSNGNGVWDDKEAFVDKGNGIWNSGEPYVDANENGKYDLGEEFEDLGNGVWDADETLTDTNGNGVWDGAEPFTDVNGNGKWDDDEVYTDANDNGVWDDAEPLVDGNGNGKWDDAEVYTDYTGNGVWDNVPEEYTDRNGNGKYDDAEPFVDKDGSGKCEGAEQFDDTMGNGRWDVGEDYVDAPNGTYDLGEIFIDKNENGVWDDAETYVDSNSNGQYDFGEYFEDRTNGVYDKGEAFVDKGNGIYNYGELFTDLNGNGAWDDAEEYVDANSNGRYDVGEVFTDRGNGIYDYGDSYTDLNGNDKWDDAEEYEDINKNGIFDVGGEPYTDSNGNGVWDDAEPLEEEARLLPVEYSATSLYDYPFANGGVVGVAGNGSEANPFMVANVDHMRNMDNLYKGNNGSLIYGQTGSTVLRVNFKQVADINLNEVNNALTEPLFGYFVAENGVAYSNGFNGIYDGDNYSLYNLNFKLGSNIYENVGIFARVYRGGVIKNVSIGTSYITSYADNVGILAGSVFGGTIDNVYYEEKGSLLDSNGVTGYNFVGGLVGLLSGESDAEGVITNSNIADLTINATRGGRYVGLGNDYTGGAGGLVGSIGQYGRVQGSKNGYTVYSVSVISGNGKSGTGAGGIVGTIQASGSTIVQTALQNVKAIDVRLGSDSGNKVAVGGIVGAIGVNRRISNVEYSIMENDTTISSAGASTGFVEPTSGADGNYLNYGGGGIAGYNNGIISGAKVGTTGTFRLTLSGSMVGGIVGVNLGTVENSTVKARMYTSRTKTSAYEGGTYGGMIGYNLGALVGGSITGTKNATDDYDPTSAAYEVVSNNVAVYQPVSGSNGMMHGDSGSDTSYIYVGGVVGYNEGRVEGVANNSKLMVNRRSNDELENISYVGAICGYSTNTNISASGNAYVKFFHYLWVDQATDVNKRMYAYIGNARGNGTGGSYGTVTASAEYIGGGTIFNPASIDAGFTWTSVASGYLSGTASVYFYNTQGYTASSYAPDWNAEGVIEGNVGNENKVYGTDCRDLGGADTLWKHAYNYEGFLRYVALTVTVVPKPEE